MAWCETEFKKSRAHSHGATEGDHQSALVKMGAIPKPAEIKLPYQLRYLYDTFKQLKFSQRHDGDKLYLVPRDVLKYSEIESFCSVTGFRLSPLEVETIMNIDALLEGAANG